jgi:hypothetical protein
MATTQDDMKARDSKGNDIQAGDQCTYRPDLDSMEATFGVVPYEYSGDPCTVKIVSSITVVNVQFEGDPSVYRVHSGALVKIAAAPAPPAPPAPAPPAPPATPPANE